MPDGDGGPPAWRQRIIVLWSRLSSDLLRVPGLPLVARLARPFGRAALAYDRRDDGLRAAGIAFFAMVSFFPLVLLLASLSAFLVGDSPEEMTEVVAGLRRFAPFLKDAFWHDVENLVERRGLFSAASLVVLFFLASRVTVALEQAMRRIFGVAPGPRRGATHYVPRLRAYGMTLFVLLTIGGLFLGSNIYRYLDSLGVVGHVELVGLVAQLPFAPRLVAVTVVGFVAYQLYRRVPAAAVSGRDALVGALVFAAGHELAVVLYTRFYTARLATYTALYGSFVGLVALALWVYWLSALALYGGELVAELSGGGRRDGAAGADAAHDDEPQDEED